MLIYYCRFAYAFKKQIFFWRCKETLTKKIDTLTLNVLFLLLITLFYSLHFIQNKKAKEKKSSIVVPKKKKIKNSLFCLSYVF